MNFYLERLRNRSSELGNHYQKYYTLLDRDIKGLINRLEQARLHERIHLWGPAKDYRAEMNIIAQLGSTRKTKLTDLGCFFGLQYLQLNFNALDGLYLSITRNRDHMSTYKSFMLRTGHALRQLTRAYMKTIMQLYLPPEAFETFVFLGVGTRSDQDDIDIGVIDSGQAGRHELNRAISHLSTEMLKKAISLHFHLSEHVGSETSYSASLDEYCELLDNEIHDFVIITEMLGAARIFGSLKLRKEFNRKVIQRYYYQPERQTFSRYHEGYIRGIIGEARSLLLREFSLDRLNPKDDGLRMIKNSLFAAKTISGLRQVNAWSLIHELRRQDRKRRHEYEQLEESLTFLEIFRYLYQLLVVQEEEIFVNEKGSTANLKRVAEVMGYQRIGVQKPEHFLLSDYYLYVQQAKENIQRLLPDAVDHLKSISVFGRIMRRKKATEAGETRIGNLALRFCRETRFFKGTRFWEDIISIFASKNGKILCRLFKDYESLSLMQKARVRNSLIEWSRFSFIATFKFAILLYQFRQQLPEPDFYKIYNDELLSRVRNEAAQTQRISIVFLNFPKLIVDYIETLSEDQRRKYRQWLDRNIWGQELINAHDNMDTLLTLSILTSADFQQRMFRVLRDNPEYVHYLTDMRRLSLIGKGSLAEAERTLAGPEKQQKLVNFFNFGYFKVGLQSISGIPAKHIASQFTEFSDIFLRLVFDTIKLELDEQLSAPLDTRDLFGVFVTGGQGQEQAFSDDYDLLILLNSDDPIMLDYCVRICAKANSLITKSGIIPHYGLVEKIGSYVCTFSQLNNLLKSEPRYKYIEQSQLLCSRMIVGSSVLKTAFERDILFPFVFDERASYVNDMLSEVDSRRKNSENKKNEFLDIKEDSGGLRDIEMLLMILRVIYPDIRVHSNYQFLVNLYQKDIKKNLLKRLIKSYEFLRKIRNITRLSVFTGDKLNEKTIKYQAEVLNLSSGAEAVTPEKLFRRVKQSMKTTRNAYNEIVDRVITPWLRQQSPRP
ncbi:MAG: hypothetical protein U5R06_16545 [candidate division KSB1 bacterium]|nr:hypothetical protein [candidate division KSB1 bacterium]